MPTYSIDGPGGKTYSIDGPKGATRDQIIAKIKERQGSTSAPVDKADTSAPKTKSNPLAVVGNTIYGTAAEIAEPFIEAGTVGVNRIANNMRDPLFERRQKGEVLPPIVKTSEVPGSRESMERAGLIRPEGVPESEIGRSIQRGIENYAPLVAGLVAPAWDAGKAVLGVGKTLIGSEAAQAGKVAREATRGVLVPESERLAGVSRNLAGESEGLTGAAGAAKNDLAASKAPTDATRLDLIGKETRDSVVDAAKGYMEAREEAYAPVKAEGLQSAMSKFKSGRKVELHNALPAAREFESAIEGIPGVDPKANSYLKLLQGATEEPKASGIVLTDKYGRPQATPPSVTPINNISERSPENLMNAIRYFQDVAYGGEMSGWGSLGKKHAGDIVRGLKADLYAYEPKLGQASDIYRDMSEPLRAMSTKFGKAIESTEGGLKKDVFSKVAEQDLPERIFTKKEGVEQMKELLGGTPEASAKVDGWFERWLGEKIRNLSSEGAASHLRSSKIQPPLSAVDQNSIVPRLNEGIGKKAVLEAEGKELTGLSSDVAKKSRSIASKSENISTGVEEAERLAADGTKKGITDSLAKYDSMLSSLQREGKFTRSEFQAAKDYINKAQGAAEKRDLYRKIFKWSAVPGTVGIEEAVRRNM